MTTPLFSPLPNERVLLHSEFSPHLILKHLKTTMILTDQRVYVHEPHTVLGFIPYGGHQQSAPLERIADVYSGDTTSTRRAMIGGGIVLLGLYTLLAGGYLGGAGAGLVGLIIAAIGVAVFLTARTIGISVRSSGGGALVAHGGSADRAAADRMHAAVTIEATKAQRRTLR